MSIQEVGDLYKVLNYFLFNQIPQVLNEAFLTLRLILCFLFCFVCVCVFFAFFLKNWNIIYLGP